MAITETAYCTREQVQRSLNIADIPRLNTRVDAAVMAGARQVHGLLRRVFYPTTKTMLFDVPEASNLWLYDQELAAAPTAVSSGSKTLTVGTDVFLRPNQGPSYEWLEISYGGTAYWQSLATTQNAISITGDFGYPTRSIAAGTITSSPTASSATVVLSDSSQAGVGSLVLIDSERMLISDKTLSSTGATLSAGVDTSKATVSIPVSNGTLINPGELIMIDSERMFVEYVVGNTLTVDRAVNGATLAAHSSGAAISAPRTATVLRAQRGTTAASHTSGAAVTLLAAPSLISELNLAYALNNNQAALSAYARAASPDTTSLYRDRGRGVAELEADALAAYGRQARSRAV